MNVRARWGECGLVEYWPVNWEYCCKLAESDGKSAVCLAAGDQCYAKSWVQFEGVAGKRIMKRIHDTPFGTDIIFRADDTLVERLFGVAP